MSYYTINPFASCVMKLRELSTAGLYPNSAGQRFCMPHSLHGLSYVRPHPWLPHSLCLSCLPPWPLALPQSLPLSYLPPLAPGSPAPLTMSLPLEDRQAVVVRAQPLDKQRITVEQHVLWGDGSGHVAGCRCHKLGCILQHQIAGSDLVFRSDGRLPQCWAPLPSPCNVFASHHGTVLESRVQRTATLPILAPQPTASSLCFLPSPPMHHTATRPT